MHETVKMLLLEERVTVRIASQCAVGPTWPNTGYGSLTRNNSAPVRAVDLIPEKYRRILVGLLAGIIRTVDTIDTSAIRAGR